MSEAPPEPAIRNVSDTAIWAALYRARETERADALFRDRFARKLAGARGDAIAAQMKGHDRHAWAWVMRTVLFDRFITQEIARGADMVVNLAAGLDARPYRIPLDPSFPWIEVDRPGILDGKEAVLREERPSCALERIRLDLADVSARRALFHRLGARAKKALVITEGLLIYLNREEVGALAEDLAAPEGFRRWVFDLVSPGLLQMLRREVGDPLDRAGAPLLFGPAEGPAFFGPHGWRPLDVRSPLKTAAREKRLPLLLRFAAMLPESSGPQGSRPWSGICLMEKNESASRPPGA
jgi:methyltransferase (TIGR00027 family)